MSTSKLDYIVTKFCYKFKSLFLSIPEYLTKIIYCTAIRHTSIKEWQYLWEVYLLAPENAQIKHTTLFSLSCSSQVWILNL